MKLAEPRSRPRLRPRRTVSLPIEPWFLVVPSPPPPPRSHQHTRARAAYAAWLASNPMLPGSSSGSAPTPNLLDLAIPPSKIRKIIKLDNTLKQFSRETLPLLSYATQLFTAHAANCSFAISSIQNRRKISGRDLLDACGVRESLSFLHDDIREFVRRVQEEEQRGQKRKMVSRPPTFRCHICGGPIPPPPPSHNAVA